MKRQLEETEGATAAVRYDMRMECRGLHMGGRSCLRRLRLCLLARSRLYHIVQRRAMYCTRIAPYGLYMAI